jgi:carbon storage regulator
MLVLTRKSNENIVINDEIIIKVVEIKGNRVLLGIEAPEHVEIIREELLLARQDNRREELLSV